MKIAIMGAGGKMGWPITANLKDDPDSDVPSSWASWAGVRCSFNDAFLEATRNSSC